MEALRAEAQSRQKLGRETRGGGSSGGEGDRERGREGRRAAAAAARALAVALKVGDGALAAAAVAAAATAGERRWSGLRALGAAHPAAVRRPELWALACSGLPAVAAGAPQLAPRARSGTRKGKGSAGGWDSSPHATWAAAAMVEAGLSPEEALHLAEAAAAASAVAGGAPHLRYLADSRGGTPSPAGSPSAASDGGTPGRSPGSPTAATGATAPAPASPASPGAGAAPAAAAVAAELRGFLEAFAPEGERGYHSSSPRVCGSACSSPLPFAPGAGPPGTWRRRGRGEAGGGGCARAPRFADGLPSAAGGPSEMEPVEGAHSAAAAVCLAGGGPLAAAGHADGHVSLWRCTAAGAAEAAGGFDVCGSDGATAPGGPTAVGVAAVDPGGRLACAAAGAAVALWDGAAGRSTASGTGLWAPGDATSALGAPPAASGASPALRGVIFGTRAGVVGL